MDENNLPCLHSQGNSVHPRQLSGSLEMAGQQQILTWHTSPGSNLECQHRHGGRGRPEKLAGGHVGLHLGNGNQQSNPYWEKNELTCSRGILEFDSHPDWTLLPRRNISLICNAPLLSLPKLNQRKEKLYRQMLIILRLVLHKVWPEKDRGPGHQGTTWA